jgi:hypothetical protein
MHSVFVLIIDGTGDKILLSLSECVLPSLRTWTLAGVFVSVLKTLYE